MGILIDYLLPFAVMMGVLVAIHEGGHFAAARLLGIKVTDFAVGMGPTLWSRRDGSGCVWRLCALPIGGYVKMLGDGDASSTTHGGPDPSNLSPEDRAGMFRLRPPGHRAIVVAAGPLANFALGFLILWGLYATMGQAVTPPVAHSVLAGSPAEAAGIRPGDRFVSIGGTPVGRFEDVIGIVASRSGQATEIVVDRDGERRAVTVTPLPVVDDGLGGPATVGRMGVSGGDRVFARLGPGEAAVESARDIAETTVATLRALGELVTLERPLADMGGPVKIAEVSGDALNKFGLVSFIALAAIISVNLGVMNLLPIPVLDGGHLALYAYEAARGRPADERAVARLYRGGAVALLFLFAAITGSDIGSLIGRMMDV